MKSELTPLIVFVTVVAVATATIAWAVPSPLGDLPIIAGDNTTIIVDNGMTTDNLVVNEDETLPWGWHSPPSTIIEQGSGIETADFIIFHDDEPTKNYYAKSGDNGEIVFGGTDAATVINSAITALGATGGAVVLVEGTYEITASVNLASNVALVGQGAGTVLRIPDGHDAGLTVIYGNGIDHVLVANLRIDGNKANQTAGNMDGIYFRYVTDSKIIDCWAEELTRYGIELSYSEANIISGNDCYSNATGIYLGNDAYYNSIVGNTCASNTSHGIYIEWSYYSTITGNVCWGNSVGIYGMGFYYNTITGNAIYGNTSHGIHIEDIGESTISSNLCHGNGGHGIWVTTAFFAHISGNTVSYNDGDGILINGAFNGVVGNLVKECSQGTHNTNDGIRVSGPGSDYNSIQANKVHRGAFAAQQRYGIRIDAGTGNLVINNDLYEAGATGDYNDAGTETIYNNNRTTAGWVP